MPPRPSPNAMQWRSRMGNRLACAEPPRTVHTCWLHRNEDDGENDKGDDRGGDNGDADTEDEQDASQDEADGWSAVSSP